MLIVRFLTIAWGHSVHGLFMNVSWTFHDTYKFKFIIFTSTPHEVDRNCAYNCSSVFHRHDMLVYYFSNCLHPNVMIMCHGLFIHDCSWRVSCGFPCLACDCWWHYDEIMCRMNLSWSLHNNKCMNTNGPMTNQLNNQMNNQTKHQMTNQMTNQMKLWTGIAHSGLQAPSGALRSMLFLFMGPICSSDLPSDCSYDCSFDFSFGFSFDCSSDVSWGQIFLSCFIHFSSSTDVHHNFIKIWWKAPKYTKHPRWKMNEQFRWTNGLCIALTC